jgi:hypothetical protein
MRLSMVLVWAGLLLASAGAAAAAQGQFGNLCAEGLALHQQIQTDCSVHSVIDGKLYCFGNAKAKKIFLLHPDTNLKKAEAYYATLHQ